MFGFAAPLWILGLAAVPLLRWLHRWRAPLTRTSVSALFLWSGSSTSATGSEQRRKPDPAWRRRALIAALVALALAKPFISDDDAAITIWIDDTLSMATVEDNRSRLATGLLQLEEAIDRNRNVTLRSLGNRARSISANDPRAFDENFWLIESPLAASPPPAALMATDSEHWLVTDGTSVFDWSNNAPLTRIIAVGQAHENAGVVRLAARRSVVADRAIDVLVTIANRGSENTRRNVVLTTTSGIRTEADLAVAGADHATAEFTLPVSAGMLVATLQPGDLLTADDSIDLDITVFGRVPAHVDETCPAALQRVIDAHTGLRRVREANEATLQLLCSDRAPVALSAVRFYRGSPAPVEATPAWLPLAGSLQNLQMRRAWTSATQWPHDPLAADRNIALITGSSPLVTYGEGTPITVETVVDVADSAFIDQPEYAAFVAGLIDLAMGRAVLDPVAAVEREARESDIRPVALAATADPSSIRSATATGFADILLALAAVILLLDIVILWRAKRESQNG